MRKLKLFAFLLALMASVGMGLAQNYTDVSSFSALQSALSAGNNVRLTSNITCTSSITLSNVQLTIDGNGYALNGAGGDRAFYINSSVTIMMKNVTLNGFDLNAGGGAIRNYGTLIFDGCTISNNHTDGSNQGGGAIENGSGAKLYAINTTFSGNYSSEIGGAINNYRGNLYLANCSFINNYTTSSNSNYGGAIGVNQGNQICIINCTFSGNKYGTNAGASDMGVYSTPSAYTIAGCTGMTIRSNSTMTTYNYGSVAVDFSDLNNIQFSYTNSNTKTNVTGIVLDKNLIELTVGGETETIVATVSPNDATDKTVNWTSNDPSVATVVNGVVTPVGVGSTTITATATNGTNETSDDRSASCTVNVAPAPPQVIDLSTITGNYVIPDGATLTGTLQNNVKLTIADNATITLSDVNINWNDQWTSGDYAGLTCNNATIILADCSVNRIKGFLDGAAGIHVLPNYTLTIEGNGTLYTATHNGGAGIGCGYGSGRNGGNIVINGGTIYAIGGNLAAGIGAGGRAKIGNITINGGIITATGGGNGAGIGCGQTKNGSEKSQCGNITITNGVKYLKATKGSGSDQCIGKGSNSSIAVCGTVTINGTTGAISTSPYTYSPAADNVKNLINAIGSVAYTQACKDKIDAARAAYDALADYTCDADAVNALKAAVSNYSTLTNAEAAYDALEADHNAANAVIDLINAIDDPVVYTDACHQEILDAREAYNNLTQAQKDLIDASTLQKLTDAETAYAALTPSADPTIFAGFTATAGSDGYNNEDYTKLVDGKFAPGNEWVDWTKWCTHVDNKSVPSGESESCWWVDFYAASPIAVTGYILTTGNDNVQWGNGRNPNSWKIKAKLNENDPWTTIATVTNDNTMQVADFTDFAFNLDQAGTYKYFRFMVYEPDDEDKMQLCELRFTGNGGSTPEPSINDILQELYVALGNDVWAGYGEATGVITYAQGTEPNSFKATFMGGAYTIEIPFGDFTQAEKIDNGDGTYTYNLDVNLPAQTGLSHEVLHVTTNANGEITGIHSDVAQTDMNKVGGAIATWADLQDAMTAGGVLQLSQSLTAGGGDGALIVPAGKTVVLDLNGFSLDRHLGSAQADGCVIINNGTLAITDNVGGAEIKGGYNSGNGGAIVNNGTFTLYGGKITGNHAAQGAGVYNSVANDGTVGFWMTGGQIDGNEAASYPAIKGDVTFSNLAVVQINAGGNTVSAATAIAGLATYDYIKPVMPNMDMFAILAELHNALGNDVWAGYGEATGVITYAQGTEPNSFKATFMGGAYAIEIPFGDFTQAEKIDNGDGTYTYNLDVNLPAQTGLSHEVLHVTTNANGEITGIHSDVAQTDMNKVGGAIASWADLQDAMTAGGVLQLSQSLTATNLDGALIVPAGKTVVLDLNGFSLDRHLTSAQADGCVIINNGTLAITDNVGGAEIKGGYNSGNGGAIVNNGTFTLYGGKITGNHAAQGAGVYNSVTNDGTVGFWMTGGLIDGNEASSYPAIKGDVTFSNLAVVQINAQGATVSAATAIAGLAAYDYIKPVMPNMDMFAILAELHAALGNDVWTGYGTQTGVISYAQGDEPNSFKATFMGGTYEINIPFGDFTSATKTDNGDGTFTYDLVVNLPAQTGMSQEILHVTTNANGEILEMESENAGVELQKETDGTIATWADLQNALNAGGVVKLTNDIVGGNAPLVIPENTTVVLDLNGHTIDRGMPDAEANGSVIVNNGTLAIVDNSELANGVITGGKTTGNGGGVLNNGVFTLYAGEITGNAAAIGGGVYNNGGEQGFWMTGGLIDGNTATNYPAIGGDVIFNNMAQIQINADGDKVTIDEAIAGMSTYSYIKPVMPNYDDYTTEVAITANVDPKDPTVYYSTFYDSANKYMLPAGVEAYVADLSGNDLVLTKIAGAGQVIPADEAVIFKATTANFALVPSFEAPVSIPTNNDLEGVDHATLLSDLSINPANCYVLSGKSHDETLVGVGFYKIYGNTLKAHKAYVIYNGSQNFAPKRMRFVFNNEQTATGINNTNAVVESQKILENGQVIIIRNGIRYNAAGQIVK